MYSFYQDLGFKVNAEEDRLRFDLLQDMDWDDFERAMQQIHLICGDIASFIPFANPRAANSGKPKTRKETQSKDKTRKYVEYEYYD